MKKLVSVLLALLLVGSFAFAEVNVGAWGRLLVAPVSAFAGDYETDDNMAFVGPNWGGRGRVGVNFSGTSDNVGFSLNVDSNGNTLGVGDQAKAWVKINDMVKVQFGKIQGDVLRGKIDDSSFLGAISAGSMSTVVGTVTYAIPNVVTTTGKDSVFKRFYPQAGLLLDLTPAEGVYIGAAVDPGTAGTTTENLFKTVQVGAGYMIPDVGHLRAQYIGGVDDAAKYMQVAFAYTAMEGLVVDAGLKYQSEADMGQSNFTVHATYAMDALSLIGRAGVLFGSATDVVDANGVTGSEELGYSVSADVGYKVADPMSVGVEVSFAKQDDPMGITVLPYGKLGYSNGYMKIGFEYTSFSGGDTEYTTWALPLIMEYSF